MTIPRHPSGSPHGGGRFAAWVRSEVGASRLDSRDLYLVVDGACINCGHYDDHTYCENCSPSCSECGAEVESYDQTLCEDCAEQDAEWFDEDAEPWE